MRHQTPELLTKTKRRPKDRAKRAGTERGRGDKMQEIAALEGRITAALERISKGVDRLAATPRPAPPVPNPPAVAASAQASASADAALRAQLEEEKALVAVLQEKLRNQKDREPKGDLQDKIDRLTQQLDVQGLELQRMRRTNTTLRDQLASLRQAQMAGVTEPQLINKSLVAELDALRALRLTEVAEMDEILAALEPHLTPTPN